MKKRVWLPLLSIGTVSALAPLTIACGDNRSIQQVLYDDSLNYFVGKNFKGGICSIPHGSYNLNQIRNFIVNAVKSAGIKTSDIYRDLYGNVWYDIPATEDSESVKPLVLQAHMDMVWTTLDQTLTHPIPVKVIEDGEELIRTKDQKSSLGADNGAGLALMLAITKNRNKFSHGPIRCIMTADEEPGMVGASQIGFIDGKEVINVVDPKLGFNFLLNIDAETEGQLFVSCAGGYSADYSCYGFKTENIPNNFKVYELDIKNMLGGHSGTVMDQGPVNGPKICAQFADAINSESFRYIDISTFETVGNVIPKNTTLVFASNKPIADLYNVCSEIENGIKAEHEWAQKDFDMEIIKVEDSPYNKELNQTDTAALTNLLKTLEFGVSREKEGEKASGNLCPFELHLNDLEKQLDFMVFDRSEQQNYLTQHYINPTNKAFSDAVETFGVGSHINIRSNYPAYEYKTEDRIRECVESIYQNLGLTYTEEHTMGGIECAWWSKYNPNINQTSIGPTIDHAHEVEETLHLKTYMNLISVVFNLIDEMKHFI